jgi:hypothetical protein
MFEKLRHIRLQLVVERDNIWISKKQDNYQEWARFWLDAAMSGIFGEVRLMENVMEVLKRLRLKNVTLEFSVWAGDDPVSDVLDHD